MSKHLWEPVRSFNSLKEREEFLFKDFTGPYTISTSYKIKDLDKVAEKIKRAIKNNVPIRIVGDYDVDGTTATAEAVLLIKDLGGKDVNYYIPRRFSDGYGISPSIVERFLTGTPGLLITVDNGISGANALKLAKEMGWETIIMDHHPVTGEMATADIIIDPNALPKTASFTAYCAAGLVFKLAQSISDVSEGTLAKIHSLATLGTICDTVPLIEVSGDKFVYDNYLIVKEGLHTILQNNGRTTGLYCLLRMLNKDISINEDDLGFIVGPVMNAMSRMQDDGADTVVKLLLMDSNDFNACDEIARILIQNNDDRKEIERNLEPLLFEQIELNGWENDFPIVVSGDIPQGLVGLVAAKISEKYNTAAIVFTNEEIMHGSARSPKGTDIKKALDECASLITSYGGHKQAAGVSIRKDVLNDFRLAMQKAAGKKPEFLKYRQYDFEISTSEIAKEIENLNKYRPFGEGHFKPMYKVKNFICKKVRDNFYNIMGATKSTLKLNGHYANAICFKGVVEQYLAENCPLKVNVYGHLSTNTWNGKIENQILFDEYEKA